MWTRRVIATLLSIPTLTFAATLVASDVAVASPQKAAQKQLAAAADDVLSDFKKRTKVHKKFLFSEFDQADLALKSGLGGFSTVVDVFDALQAFQTSVISEVDYARNRYREGMGLALQILADAGLTPAEWPKGFQYGDGGISDELKDDVEAALRKLYVDIEKRLRDTGTLFKKKEGMKLNFRLSTPTTFVEWATAPGGSGGTNDVRPITVDIALSVSTISSAGDGVVFLGGSGHSSHGIDVSRSSSSISADVGTVSVNSAKRWSFVESGLTEEQYIYTAYPAGLYCGSAHAAISVG